MVLAEVEQLLGLRQANARHNKLLHAQCLGIRYYRLSLAIELAKIEVAMRIDKTHLRV